MGRFSVTPLRFTQIAGALLASLAVNTAAHADDARSEDIAAVSACLSLVQENQRVRVPGTGEPEEQSGPAGRLAAAKEAAPSTPESCIGIVANACQRKEDSSTTAMIECHSREAAVWDARLNAAYKKLQARSEADEIEGFRTIQRTWMAYRDATCAQPRVVYKGTMAGSVAAYCVMELTARQAIWLEGWSTDR